MVRASTAWALLGLALLGVACGDFLAPGWNDDRPTPADDDDLTLGDDDDNDDGTPSGDRDGDTILDLDEGSGDVDSDGTDNADDVDSDGDGLPDALEAGDADPASAPVDSEGDGTPDFLDSDSDNNGILDTAEGAADSDGDGVHDAADGDNDGDGISDVLEIGPNAQSPLDSDGDGVPNHLDEDSDGDGLPDVIEGGDDADGDGVPNSVDQDSDGDGFSDATEAGVDPAAPLDTDLDGFFDFEDADSDNDGIPDDEEAGYGTSRFERDTDADGFTDLAEVAAGTNPLSAASGILGYYAELTPRANTTLQVPFTPEILKADVLFVLDSTCSMTEELQTMAGNFSSVVSANVIPDLAFGVAEFQDYALEPYGFWWFSDKPFRLAQQVTTSTSLVQSALNALTPITHDGGDFPESSMEALTQALTGVGFDMNGNNQYDTAADVRPFITSAGDAFGGLVAGVASSGTPGTGTLGGAGFRDGAIPIVVYTTDNLMRDSDQPGSFGLPPAVSNPAGLGDVAAAAGSVGAKLIGIGTDTTPQPQMISVANQTGSLADLDGNGSVEPLVFVGLDTSVVTYVISGISALTNSGQFDLTLVVDDSPFDFVVGIEPAVFPAVTVGSTVTFAITLYPGVPLTPTDQVFVFPMQVIGDGVGVLAEWELVLVVLAGS